MENRNTNVFEAKKTKNYGIASIVTGIVAIAMVSIILILSLINIMSFQNCLDVECGFMTLAITLILLVFILPGISISTISIIFGYKSLKNCGKNIDNLKHLRQRAKTGIVFGSISLAAALVSIAITVYFLLF